MNNVISRFNLLAAMIARHTELLGAGVILMVVFMIIVPLPLWLLDGLIAINICVACLMITVSMFLSQPLAFSSFPAVLLITTMFRLALSISATRMILLHHDGGHIINAFGNFVVGGNLAVGLVVFLIIAVVNFLVITKGSERVAEVSARFTLDGLPGKQMSIDSDLRANLISPDDARRKRDRLGRESQLFGAMDGAMKFVKGDAIACLLIVVINMIAGLAIGMLQQGMGINEALTVYSVLSIGDGLVAQIPALLIALSAGMIITRVSQDEEGEQSNVGRDVILQMSQQPRAWLIASVGMLLFALLPGMPTIVFLMMSAVSALAGYCQYRMRARKASPQGAQASTVPPEENGREDIRTFNLARPYVIQLPERYAGHENELPLVQAIRKRRNRMVTQIGMTQPDLNVECSSEIAEDEFRFCIYEVPVMSATLTDRVAVRQGPLPAQPLDYARGEESRAEQHLLWIAAEDPLLEHGSVEFWRSEELIVERVEDVMFSSAHRFLGLQECRVVLNWLEAQIPELAQELQRNMPLTRFSSVMKRLVSEQIPLRAVRPIAEALVEHGQYERDIAALADYVRIALKEQIYEFHKRNGALNVWLLTPEMEGVLRDSLRQTQTGVFLQLEHHHAQSLVDQLVEAFPVGLGRDDNRLLLVAPDIRCPMRDLLLEEFSHIPVLSFAELSSNAKVEVMGRLDFEEDAAVQSAMM